MLNSQASFVICSFSMWAYFHDGGLKFDRVLCESFHVFVREASSPTLHPFGLWCQADLGSSSGSAVTCSLNLDKVLSYSVPQFLIT